MAVLKHISFGFFGTFGHDLYRKGLKVFANLAVLNAVVSVGQAYLQNEYENEGRVPEDGMSMIQDGVKQFFWDNPKSVVVWTGKGIAYLFNGAADLHENTKDGVMLDQTEHNDFMGEYDRSPKV